MSKKKAKIPKKTFPEIEQQWNLVKQMDLKNRMKAMRTLAFDIANSYDKNTIVLSELEFYIQVLQLCLKNQAHLNQFKTLRQKMIKQFLELTGADQVEILLKINGKVSVESGMIMVGDPHYLPHIKNNLQDFSQKNLDKIIQEKQAYFFETGGDGVFNIQLRIIKGAYPVLSNKEYTFVYDSSETTTLEILSGKIAAADLLAIDNPQAITATLENGTYKITVFTFSIPNKVESYYIVLSKN